MDQKELIDLLEENYKLLGESNAKWLDKRAKYLLARIFTGKKLLFPITDFDWLDTTLNHKAGLFSSMTKMTRHTLVGLMIASQKNSIEGIEELFFNKKILKDNDFKSSGSTYFAAYQLFFSESSKRENVAKRGNLIYQEIKNNHPLITTSTDYSSMISLAQAKQLKHLTEKEICDLVEFYFNALQEIGLKSKNSCLVAATLATLMTGTNNQTFIDTLKDLITFFEKSKIKIKNLHFVPLISLTYLVQESEKVDLEELLTFIEEISENVSLFFETDYKQALAISLYIENQSRTLNKASLTTLSVSLHQVIVQEQTILATNVAALLG